MDQMFDIQTSEICDNIADIRDVSNRSVESIKDLILKFWYQQAFTAYGVCCSLVAAGTHSINC